MKGFKRGDHVVVNDNCGEGHSRSEVWVARRGLKGIVLDDQEMLPAHPNAGVEESPGSVYVSLEGEDSWSSKSILVFDEDSLDALPVITVDCNDLRAVMDKVSTIMMSMSDPARTALYNLDVAFERTHRVS